MKKKTDLESAIEYATNKDKNSDEKIILEDAINCLKDDAFEKMTRTKEKHNKTDGILGYHIIHSYKPSETTPQIAHEISTEFARRCFGDRYEVVISTHLDKKHLHSHIVINSVSFVDGKKYRSDFKSYYDGIRKTNDEICREYGLSIINTDLNKKSLTYIDWLNLQKGNGTYRDRIKADIDQAIPESFSYGEFLVTMEELGYAVKQGKYIAFRPAGKERFFARAYNLGCGYSEDEIRARIDDSPLPPVNAYAPPTMQQREQNRKSRYMPDVERRYLWMLYQLGLVQKRQAPPMMTKYLKGELDKLEKYK